MQIERLASFMYCFSWEQTKVEQTHGCRNPASDFGSHEGILQWETTAQMLKSSLVQSSICKTHTTLMC